MKNKKLISLVTVSIAVGTIVILSTSLICAKSFRVKNNSVMVYNNQEDENKKTLKCKNCEEKKAALDKLVKDKTITQAQEDKIIEYINEKKEKRIIEKNKIKDMTEAERKEYLSKKQRNNSVFLTELVDKGVITKTQAAAVKKVLPRRHEKKHFKSMEEINNDLNKLVESQTITKDQEDKIIEYINKRRNDKKAEFDKLKDMTEEEKKDYFKNNPRQGHDFMKELVDSKVIDENQAEAIKKAMEK